MARDCSIPSPGGVETLITAGRYLDLHDETERKARALELQAAQLIKQARYIRRLGRDCIRKSIRATRAAMKGKKSWPNVHRY